MRASAVLSNIFAYHTAAKSTLPFIAIVLPFNRISAIVNFNGIFWYFRHIKQYWLHLYNINFKKIH